MRRLFFLLLITVPTPFAAQISRAEEPGSGKGPRQKPPFRVLFSNDTTNIMSCVSPYHEKREPFRPEMLQATVDETAGTGVEVHLLQPGLGWVPWWKSKVYPADEHYRWFTQMTGLEPKGIGSYLLEGGDIVKLFLDRCREKGLVPFISLRLNDGHQLEAVAERKGKFEWISRFYFEHPEYRLGSDLNDWGQRVQNWAIPEVREYKFAFIREICENYDIGGFELDFMRFWRLFREEETTSEQRSGIVTEFVSQVRKVLDRTAKPGQHRWLCVRVPVFLAAHDALGIDLPAMVNAGVDMVNLSASYFTNQQTDLREIRKMIPNAALYLEMTHCTTTEPAPGGGTGNAYFRPTTDEQFYTTAHLAYARGADGVSAFNFVYYREHVSPDLGPYTEPPFHVFKHLGDPAWLARQPQHYILAKVGNKPPVPNVQMPKTVHPKESVAFTLDMAPPEGGWQKDGRLRIQGKESFEGSQLAARFNGADLKPTDDVSEPYPNPYPNLLGKPDQLRAWIVPVGILRDGTNRIEIQMTEGKPVKIDFLDLAVR